MLRPIPGKNSGRGGERRWCTALAPPGFIHPHPRLSWLRKEASQLLALLGGRGGVGNSNKQMKKKYLKKNYIYPILQQSLLQRC